MEAACVAIEASLKIFTQESDLVIAGGQESMSRARHAYLSRTAEKKLGIIFSLIPL